MPITISTNVASLYAQGNLAKASDALNQSFQRLSSGFRINPAKDDAAGLAISEGLRAQTRSFAVAERNANNAISMVTVAEGALGQIGNVLVRMRELAVQSANGDLTSADRGYLETEFASLKTEISRVSGSTKFNGTDVLQSTVTSVQFQIGINATANDVVTVNFGGVSVSTLSVETATLTTAAAAQTALTSIDSGISTVANLRAKHGSSLNRLQVTVANTQTMRTNLAAAESRIRDVDVAEESAQLARSQVLMQAGASILAQANQMPSLALGLLR